MSTFEFVRYGRGENGFYFDYLLRAGSKEYSFTETIDLPSKLLKTIQNDDPILNLILINLHLILGISYWKIKCSENIVLKTTNLTKDQADYWNTVYEKGLGEFFYKNNIDFRGLVDFPYSTSHKVDKISQVNFQNQPLVGVGGGKDSLLVMDILEKSNFDYFPVVIETQKPYKVIENILKQSTKSPLIIKRHIDESVFAKTPVLEGFDGHIPISAVYAWTMILAAYLSESPAVIVGNERSSNEGNVEYLGRVINHQWSKSLEFETLTQKYLYKFVVRGISYFSLLRGFSELQITKKFIESVPVQMLFTFSSCNRNFSINRVQEDRLWCGKCPKCAFVYAALAAFLPKKTVDEIFKADLFSDLELLPTYQALLGEIGNKPFECVGTSQETRYAFCRIIENKEYKLTPIVSNLYKVISKYSLTELEAQVMTPEMLGNIPSEYINLLKNL